ncbi:MAG: ribbon-helix-helix domain-containing protein [Chloroflexi bacterium]|nr:ribbon-helix-helix domain-containing protein [Chloroflexota bacterium]
MIRTQIQLTEKQHRALKELAASQKVSVARIIRESVAQYLNTSETKEMDELRQYAISIAGKYHSGKTDISINHDEYLAEAYADALH